MNNEVSKDGLEYDGQCAFAVSTGKTSVKGGSSYTTKDCKTYTFSNPVAKILFLILPNRIKKADAVWKNR